MQYSPKVSWPFSNTSYSSPSFPLSARLYTPLLASTTASCTSTYCRLMPRKSVMSCRPRPAPPAPSRACVRVSVSASFSPPVARSISNVFGTVRW